MTAMANRGILHEIERRNTAFSLWFIVIFTLSFAFLYTIDVVPDPAAHWKNTHGGALVASATDTSSVAVISHQSSVASQSELPVRIVSDQIGLDANVSNPTSTNTEVLDQYLKKGAVRYPTSAMLSVNGTVVLFAHSTYLPVVANPAYRTFTDIQKLKVGQEVSVYSGDREYRYQVTSVTKVHASDGTVALKTDGQYLVLVTCDTFDKVLTDRWVVEAKLAGIYSLSN
jgi:LPXTG-site transpeptidase (sortase) family protein